MHALHEFKCNIMYIVVLCIPSLSGQGRSLAGVGTVNLMSMTKQSAEAPGRFHLYNCLNQLVMMLRSVPTASGLRCSQSQRCSRASRCKVLIGFPMRPITNCKQCYMHTFLIFNIFVCMTQATYGRCRTASSRCCGRPRAPAPHRRRRCRRRRRPAPRR